MGCDGVATPCGANATAPGEGVVTSNAVGSSTFVMIGVDGIATRGGALCNGALCSGALGNACEGGGRLGVPTDNTGWLGIFAGAAPSSPLTPSGASGRPSGGLDSLMQA